MTRRTKILMMMVIKMIILTYSFSFCDINNIKYFYARLPHQFLNQLKFFGCLLFFLNPIPSISQLYYCCYCYYYYIFHITTINVFIVKNLTLSTLLPLSLVFLFFLLLLILLYLFLIVSFSQWCYSYQVNIAIVASFVNFLIYTFAFYLWVSASQVFF